MSHYEGDDTLSIATSILEAEEIIEGVHYILREARGRQRPFTRVHRIRRED